jgi:predicted 2-oxoglutarate/Fe(II)-dependent dioxygenase YbiX
LLPRLLATVGRRGDYCAQGSTAIPVVRLAVNGVGTLGLPIPSSQARSLLAVATLAPYGRGAETIHDPDVRRCGQIPASSLQLDDPRWRALLTRIVAEAAAALGVDGQVRAELYKLLVYQPGDFFAPHRDTEKVPGMFATLVIALPAEHEGGELVVRHAGREAVLDLSGEDLGLARWAAF